MSYDCYRDHGQPTWIRVAKVKKARRPHRCPECGARIPAGAPYEYVSGVWEGYFSDFHTCALCKELRDWATISVPCFCWAYGELLSDVREMVGETAPDVPGMFFEYGRRMVAIKRAKERSRAIVQ